MEPFQARRITKQYNHQLSAPAGKVFPLLCPTREYEWIDGWSCTMIHSETGVAEDNCVFQTTFPRGVDDLFVVSRYVPEQYVIEFVVLCHDLYVLKMDVSLQEVGDNGGRMQWINTFTGLTPEGNAFIEAHAHDASDLRMSKLVEALEHYCLNGTMLKQSSIPGSLHAAPRSG
jgi:hypothetical protein